MTQHSDKTIDSSSDAADPAHIELPRSVLVVEDDPDVRKLVVKSLRSSEVSEAANGLEGLEMLRRDTFEFLITDLLMPEMDGLEMIQRARRTVPGSCIPILVLTSVDEERTLLTAFSRGADDYMVKPFSLAELRIRVSSIYMRQKRASDMNPLSGLPGNMVLKREITERIQGEEPVAVAYIDIDHFKSFNDLRGFDRGDHVIKLMADLLRHYARRRPAEETFIGHLGGDDFVAILPLSNIKEFAGELHQSFAAATAPLFSDEELAAGCVRVVNRRGEEEEVPLLSVSIGVVSTARKDVKDLRKISQIAAEVKKVAKSMPGNSLFIDRRTS